MIGQRRKAIGGLLRHLLGKFPLLEERGELKDRFQRLAAFRRQQIVERKGARALAGVGEVGVDDDAIDVAHDEQRRILQRLTILQQLLIGFIEVGVFALIFQREELALHRAGASSWPRRIQGEVLAVIDLRGGMPIKQRNGVPRPSVP
jgi:hypothetical protein